VFSSSSHYDGDAVIPTVLLPAAIVGRLWFIPIAALGWAVLIVSTNSDADASLFFGAAAFAGANATAGVAVHKALVLLARGFRSVGNSAVHSRRD
jgi:hypothetical protein